MFIFDSLKVWTRHDQVLLESKFKYVISMQCGHQLSNLMGAGPEMLVQLGQWPGKRVFRECNSRAHTELLGVVALCNM